MTCVLTLLIKIQELLTKGFLRIIFWRILPLQNRPPIVVSGFPSWEQMLYSGKKRDYSGKSRSGRIRYDAKKPMSRNASNRLPLTNLHAMPSRKPSTAFR